MSSLVSAVELEESIFGCYPLVKEYIYISKMVVSVNRNEEALKLLLSPQIPRLISRYAILIFHQIIDLMGDDSPPKTIASACLIHAMNVHGGSWVSMQRFIFDGCDTESIIPLQVCITQLVRSKVILVESCLRINLQKLVMHNTSLLPVRKHIARVALSLSDKVYQTKYCLYPSRAAAALLTHSCFLLGLQIQVFPWKAERKIKLIQSHVFS